MIKFLKQNKILEIWYEPIYVPNQGDIVKLECGLYSVMGRKVSSDEIVILVK